MAGLVQVAEPDVPTTPVVGVVPCEEIHERVDRHVDDDPQAPRVDFHFAAVGSDSQHSAAAAGHLSTIGGCCFDETEITDGDVEPTVDAHTNAVGGVVGSPHVQLVGGDALDQHLLSIGRSVMVLVMKHAQQWRVQHPQLVVVEEQPAGVIHLGELVDLVGVAVAVGVSQPQHVALTGFLAQ